MDPKEILRFCLEKGFLLDNEVLSIFDETFDAEFVKLIIGKIKDTTNQKIITKSLFIQNKEMVFKILSELSQKNPYQLEVLKVRLGLSIEVSKEVSKKEINKEKEVNSVRVLSSVPTNNSKKIEVRDFVTYFRNRFSEMKTIIQGNPTLKNLVSINKVSNLRNGFSIIGLVSEKTITKNKNMLLEVEDLTGKMRVLINQNNEKLYERAEDICLDSVLGFSGFGNKEILFASDIVFPEASLPERKNSNEEEYALFCGDLHYGSKLFLEKNFLKFIDYLNGKVPNTPEVSKIKYLFLVGDVVAGVGNYPNQERDLKIQDIEEQFLGLSSLLEKVPKHIQIIISPGNHDGVRLMEPQPAIKETYAWNLYNMENVILTGNPCYLNIGANSNFSGFDVLTYHGFSFPYYANTIPKLITGNTLNAPDKIMVYLLKNRHLAPAHSSVQYFPFEEDPLLIRKIPDIFLAGHTHKSGIIYYNNLLVVSVSSWESKTPYQEKLGNEPDFCKVPMFNLKTRAIKILDFEEKE